MLSIFDVPIERMRQAQVNWDIEWRGSPDRESLSGLTGTIVNQMPRWLGAPRLVLGPSQIGNWRRLLWLAQGRANALRLTMFDPAIANLSNPDATVPADAAASAGDTSIDLEITDSALVPSLGQILSAGDWPMGVTEVTDQGSNVYRVKVQPPLRADIALAADVRLVGQGIFQLATEATGALAYDAFGKATPSLRFLEIIGR